MLHRLLPARVSQSAKRRSASATVELAVCLPVIMLITAGAIEGANFAFLRQTLAQSAYEGIKVAVRRNSNGATGLQAAQEIIQQRNLQGVTFQYIPASPENVPSGSPVTLVVSAPGDTNSQLPIGPFMGRTITIRATMARE